MEVYYIMILKNLIRLIRSVKSVNAKFEDTFNGINKISANMLIFGQLFLLLILAADLLYAAHRLNTCKLISNPRVLFDLIASVKILFENSASGLFLLWSAAILLDYIDKNIKT